MTLTDWLKAQGYGGKHRLHMAAQVSPRVIDNACNRRASLESAEKIHAATGEAVELWHMTTARDAPVTSRRRASAR
jgi:hypothetical protein